MLNYYKNVIVGSHLIELFFSFFLTTILITFDTAYIFVIDSYRCIVFIVYCTEHLYCYHNFLQITKNYSMLHYYILGTLHCIQIKIIF